MGREIISNNHRETLKFLVEILSQHNIEYQFTGGLAGNVYGSTWPLHDIDLEVAQNDIGRVADIFKDYTVRPLSRFVDEEFDLMLLGLRINQVDVEINQVEDAWIFTNGIRTQLNTDLSRKNKMNFLNLELYVQPLEDIIKYKNLLGRQADINDLMKLKL
jgi:hypothetical protein